MSILSILREIWRGKDVYRIFMNKECSRHTIKGRVLDVGSGVTRASYHRFLQQAPGAEVEYLDLGFESGAGKGEHIDLETDPLPQEEASVDSVLLFNVLEHIYNYSHLLAEIKRVLKSGGNLMGAVPFLVAYHPDPHDYWRYTKEALEKVFTSAGFTTIQITPFGYGPGIAGFSQMEPALPRFIKFFLIPKTLLFDWVVLKFRPKMGKERFALGLFFKICKD